MPVNVEIKAHCPNLEKVAAKLMELGADHKGTDHQVDTYFKVNSGRLKLREGNIENNLIFYKRSDQDGPKRSDVVLYPANAEPGLKQILSDTMGVLVVVDKRRDIFFIHNVKFHIDHVVQLGSFVEIEAIGEKGEEEKLEDQCKYYMDELDIADEDLVSVSYSDLLIERNEI
jgi:predicted adenylyl cyclase CyaB